MFNSYYPGIANSPLTLTTAAIDSADTTIEVSDVSVFPAAPNLATVGQSSATETVLYTGTTSASLTGVTRGYQGTAAAWGSGTIINRNFTAYDHDGSNENVASLINTIMWGGL
jgi:hypothetical protein